MAAYREDEEGLRMIESRDVVIIGGGPAGLAAAVELDKRGIHDIVILEREHRLGGILRQCIHDGFGLHRFGESLSGPEYAQRFIDEVQRRGIEFHTDSTVTSLSPERIVKVDTPSGLHVYKAGAVILTMGCKERSRGSIMIPGERPAGVFTAGTAQAYMNIYNRMPGHDLIILGSGDIGLIMARRMTLEGCSVKAVFEIQDHPNGLDRNITQCLDDYGIPLYLRHTVTDIHGKERLEGVTVSEVDGNMAPIPGTEVYYPCDTLILSVGLRPENDLLKDAGIEIDERTSGAVVDESLMTSIPGIFSSGNVLHVHDLVDFVSLESERLAAGVASFIGDGLSPDRRLQVMAGRGIAHVVPQRLSSSSAFSLSFRVRGLSSDSTVRVRQGEQVIVERRYRRLNPAEMVNIDIAAGSIGKEGNVEVEVV